MNIGFYNFSLPIQYKSSYFQLDIDLNNKNIVKDYSIEGMSVDDNSLDFIQECFRDLINSKKDIFHRLESLIELSDVTEQKFVLWLIHQKLFYSLNDHLLKDSEPLLCRCFGLSRKDLSAVIVSSQIRDMLSLTKETNAGAGCGSCVSDIMKVYELMPRKFEEEEVSSQVSVLTEKKPLYDIGEKKVCASELLLQYLFPLAENEGLNIASLIDHHLYTSKGQLRPDSELLKFCEKTSLKLITI